MIGTLIELTIGWFLTYKVSDIIGVKGTFAIIIKIIGVIILIGGFVNLVRWIFGFLQ